jgi:hypothetical protein
MHNASFLWSLISFFDCFTLLLQCERLFIGGDVHAPVVTFTYDTPDTLYAALGRHVGHLIANCSRRIEAVIPNWLLIIKEYLAKKRKI